MIQRASFGASPANQFDLRPSNARPALLSDKVPLRQQLYGLLFVSGHDLGQVGCNRSQTGQRAAVGAATLQILNSILARSQCLKSRLNALERTKSSIADLSLEVGPPSLYLLSRSRCIICDVIALVGRRVGVVVLLCNAQCFFVVKECSILPYDLAAERDRRGDGGGDSFIRTSIYIVVGRGNSTY